MNVVRHQAVRVQRALPVRRPVLEQGQIDNAIGIAMETILPVVAPLHDVQRDVWNDQPRVSPHAGRTPEPRRSLTE
jgi:hypothetical protein